ncbi:hypothetical protein ABPG74_018557 [Tetrahymena malaccensis]
MGYSIQLKYMIAAKCRPKEITDIKKFMKLWQNNKDTPATAGAKKVVYVKTNKRITKFKLRGKKYLYTFKTADAKIAKGIKDAIPATYSKIEIKGKNTKKATKRS